MTRSSGAARSASTSIWGPAVSTVIVVGVLLGLGVWQLERRAWKAELIATRTSRIAADPVALPPAPDLKVPDLKTMEYRRVSLRGRFLHDREMLLNGRSWGGRLGYHVITPLALQGGGTLLVNRGWVPLDRKHPKSRAEGQVEGEVALTGHLRAQPPKGTFSPDNDPAKNFWFRVNIAQMGKHARLEGVRPFFVQAAEPAPPGGLPRPAPVRIDLPNDHLKYALTWFALAAAFVAIFVIWIRKRPRA